MHRFLLGLLLLPGSAGAMSVYGRDNRRDIHEVPAKGLRELSRSVVALFKREKVSIDGKTAALSTIPLLEHLPIHPSERFAEQPAGASCTGALIAPDLVLTAGHCFRTTACADISFVFDYAYQEAGQDPTVVPASSVYGCGTLLVRRDDDKDDDWALVKLDRAVTDRQPLELETGTLEPGHPIFTIGHPFGLPAKYAGSAEVRESAPFGFTSDLDALSGNSGGPVFSATTRKIVGLVSRGDPFLVQDLKHPGLATVAVFGHDAGVGTIVMDSARIAKTLENRRRAALFGGAEAARIRARLEAMAAQMP